MISVMHILSDSNIGGAGRYVADMAGAMDPAQYKVTVAVPPGARIVSLMPAGVDIVEVPGMVADASYSRSSVQALSALIRQRRPDIVHTHGSLAGRIAARINQVKVVYTRHTAGASFHPRSPKWHLGRWMNRGLADRVIAVSRHMARVLESEGIPESMIQIIYNGVSLERFNPGEYDSASLKSSCGLEDSLVCLAVARLEPVKGHSCLLEAWEKLQSSALRSKITDADSPLADGGSHPPYDPSRLHLVLVGDGSLRADLEQTVRLAGLKDSVTFTGALNEVRPWLALADIVVLPSLTEGLPIALIEAMAMGKPCVASAAGGIPEVITDKKDGLLVPPADPESLARALDSLLASPELRVQLGQAALNTAQEKFDVKRLAAECGALYQEICGKA